MTVRTDEAHERLLYELTVAIRLRHYSIRTEKAYVQWAHRFLVRFRGLQPVRLGTVHVRTFISELVTRRDVAASTQNQALNALVFFFREVLEQEIGDSLGDLRWAKRPQRLPWC